MTLSDDTLAALEALAAAATPGPWTTEPRFRNGPNVRDGDGALVACVYSEPERKDADGAFIAAANPAVVAELVKEIRDHRSEIRRLRDLTKER